MSSVVHPMAWLALSLFASTTSAQTNTSSPPLDLTGALLEAVEHNPDLEAALVDLRQTEQQLRAERWRFFVPSLILDGETGSNANPSLSLVGGTIRSTNSVLRLGAELREQLPWGTTLGLRVEGSRNQSESPFGQGGSELVKLGPGYGLNSRLTLAQPLLRGFGVNVGEAELRLAVLGRGLAERARDAAASQLLRDVSVAWWELWYAHVAKGVEEAAVALAEEQLVDLQRRIDVGARARVDLLSQNTRIAELQQAVLLAQTTIDQRTLALEQLLGRNGSEGTLAIAETAPPPVEVPEREGVLAAVREASFDILQVRLQVEQSQERARTAGESSRARLDVQAWVQTQGLGNDEFAPVGEQLAAFDNVSANVGLTFELPLWGARNDAQNRGAHFGVVAAEERLRSVTLRVLTAAASERVSLEQAHRRQELSARTARLAAESLAAERKRYENGEGIALEVHQAEDQLRRARLSTERARIDAVASSLRLEHLTGQLLQRQVGWLTRLEGAEAADDAATDVEKTTP